jgi:hypothetical protein
VAPRYVVLLVDASFDQRDYFGAGGDLVPTKLVDTAEIEAASDDWLADFDGDDVPELAVGRLPARTPEVARAIVAKIVAYERASAPNPTALVVSDTIDGANFDLYSDQIAAALPASYTTTRVSRAALGDAEARARTLSALESGPGVVHYAGHGSVDIWRGGLFSVSDALGLANAPRFPIVTISNCLNNYFHDPLLASLGESLVDASGGGAVAVWGSSGITTTGGQQVMTLELYRQLFGAGHPTIGDAARQAKAAVSGDHRRTWTLLGDPLIRVR